MLRNDKLRITGGILLILFIIVVFSFFGGALAHLEQLRTYVEPYGFYAPIIFILLYIITTVAFVPGTVFTFLGGLLFGPVLGTLYSVIGSTIGACISFVIARTIGRDFVRGHLVKRFPKFHEYDSKIEEHSFMVMFILRLLPFIPTNVLNYVMGLSKMRFRGYFFGTLLGNLPATFAYANLAANATHINSPQFYIAVAIFLLALIIPYFIGKKYDKTNTL